MIHSTITELGMFFVGVEELLSFYWWIRVVSLAFSRSSQNAVCVDKRSTFYVVNSLGHNYYGVCLGDIVDFTSPHKLGGACVPKFSTNFWVAFLGHLFQYQSQNDFGRRRMVVGLHTFQKQILRQTSPQSREWYFRFTSESLSPTDNHYNNNPHWLHIVLALFRKVCEDQEHRSWKASERKQGKQLFKDNFFTLWSIYFLSDTFVHSNY